MWVMYSLSVGVAFCSTPMQATYSDPGFISIRYHSNEDKVSMSVYWSTLQLSPGPCVGFGPPYDCSQVHTLPI